MNEPEFNPGEGEGGGDGDFPWRGEDDDRVMWGGSLRQAKG